MFIRIRGTNISLERPVYVPAEKDAQGQITKPAQRTTKYIGSVRASTAFGNVPAELLGQLSDDEKTELAERLKVNEVAADYWLTSLPRSLEHAAKYLKGAAAQATPASKKTLQAQLKVVEAAWEAFYATTQDAGLKKRITRAKSTKSAAIA